MQTVIPEMAEVLREPDIVPYKARFVIERELGSGKEWWNGAQQKWIPTKLIHGPTARNPKASYYKSEVTAYDVLKEINA